MSPVREFLGRVAGGLLFAGMILSILWGGQLLAWAAGIER